MYQANNLLITGGAGFIGANFINFLIKHQTIKKIINLDKLTYASNVNNLVCSNDSVSYEFVKGDICDTSLIKTLMKRHHIDTIVHFAAESHVDRSIMTPHHFVQTNVVGTFTLLEVAKAYWLDEKKWDASHCRFHHISTDEVYGSLNMDDAAFTESTAYAPRSPYSATKAGSDHLVFAYHHTYGLPITLSNCSNNYGPFQHGEKFIPTIINACLHWQPIPIYGNGHNIRDWLYVEDHCEGIMAILKHGKIGEKYNLGGNHELDNLTLVKLICDYFDKHFPKRHSHHSLITFVKDRKGHDFRYAIDATKISAALGWQPQETFSSGLAKTIEFYLNYSRISNKETELRLAAKQP